MDVLTGFRPIVRTALSPRPMPSARRPGCRPASVANVLAIVVTWRVYGFVTAVPTTMRSVCASACVM